MEPGLIGLELPSIGLARTNEAQQGDERGTSVALDTSDNEGTRDRLRGASPTATEPP